MKMKVGDEVKVIFPGHESYGKTGKVIGVLDYEKFQFPRISFSANPYDYIDIGSWKVEKIK